MFIIKYNLSIIAKKNNIEKDNFNRWPGNKSPGL